MKIAVYCGSASGNEPHFKQAAEEMGRSLASHNIGLVYGGGNVGLMGIIADAVLEAGGHVTGIIPSALESREIAHPNLSQLEIVPDMHSRKKRMSDLADGFIAMPGGVGTLEEIFEVWTWGQLGYHNKPCGFLNTAGFYDSLLTFLDQMSQSGFMRPCYLNMAQVSDQPEVLLEAFKSYKPPEYKWSDQT